MLERVRRAWPRESTASWIAVLGAATLYATFLGYLCTLRYQDFGTFAYDMGNYNQIFWTTTQDHRFFYSTNNFALGNSGWVVLGHFSPIFALLLPLYAIAPGPPALLWMQGAALALGAVPTFGLGKQVLRSDRWGLLMAGVYLATPLTFWPVWYDFHPEVFLVAPTIAAFYFIEVRRTVPYLLSLTLAMMAVESFVPFLLAFAVLSVLPSIWRRIRGRTPVPFETSLWLGAILCGGYLLFAFEVATRLSTGNATFGVSYDFWPQIGAKSAYQVYPLALLHPAGAWAGLNLFLPQKLVYLALILGALGFVPLLGPSRFTVPGYLWFGLVLLSANADLFYVGDMYSCYVLPFFMAASIWAVARVRDWSRPKVATTPSPPPLPSKAVHLFPSARDLRLRRDGPVVAICSILALGVLVTNGVANPLTSAPVDLFWATPPGWPVFTAHDGWASKVIALIPMNASVLADGKDFPLVSNRHYAYDTPWATPLQPGQSQAGLLNEQINRSSYILLDFSIDYLDSALVLQDGNLTGFGLLAAADAVYLWERGYHGALVLWQPYSYSLAGGDAQPGNAQVDPENATALGPSLYHAPGLANGTLLWTALNLETLAPGQYSLTVHVGVYAATPGPQVILSTTSRSIVIRSLERTNYSGVAKYYYQLVPTSGPQPIEENQISALPGMVGYQDGNVTILFSWSGLGILANQGWVLSSSASVRLYDVRLWQVAP